jgi:hypothetical protein
MRMIVVMIVMMVMAMLPLQLRFRSFCSPAYVGVCHHGPALVADTHTYGIAITNF